VLVAAPVAAEEVLESAVDEARGMVAREKKFNRKRRRVTNDKR
jgi:hypothetical protein